MLVTLGLGLLMLWLVLAGIGLSFNARLRRIASRNGWLAAHDQLTGLLNRNGFAAALDRRLRAGDRPAVLLLDLEHFSEVNDILGQRAGDQLLVLIAGALLDAAPADAQVARLNGDVFGVLLTSTDSVRGAAPRGLTGTSARRDQALALGRGRRGVGGGRTGGGGATASSAGRPAHGEAAA